MLNTIFTPVIATSADSVTEGLTSAKNNVISFVKPAINNVAVPLLGVIAGCFLLFFICSAVNRHRGGEEYKDKLIGIIVCLVSLVLILSFPTWGWSMMGL